MSLFDHGLWNLGVLKFGKEATTKSGALGTKKKSNQNEKRKIIGEKPATNWGNSLFKAILGNL